MAKLTRESRLRERRLDKQARKDARKLTPVNLADQPDAALEGDDREAAWTAAGSPAVATVVPALADA